MIPGNQDSIKNLEVIRIQEKTGQSRDSPSCSICLGVLSNRSKAIRMPHPCFHIFHQHCIIKWLKISNTCPLCRRTI
uniref:RING-H2 finger protein ATL2L n=1 Tax=Cajanus cajan TaxID=3821 RepID=A0A151RW88_CAJCA|nr:RING-H2 finger protein ATL2L [Cajanus cajan]